MFVVNPKKVFVSLAAVAGLLSTGFLASPSNAAEVSGPGFTRAFTNNLTLVENRVFPVTTNINGSGPWSSRHKPLFGSVEGYPNDMQLLATVRINAPSGTTLSMRGPTDERSVDLKTETETSPLVVTLTPGLTTWLNTTELAFTGTQPAINRALSLLVINTGSVFGAGTLQFAVTQDEGAAYNIQNNHFYKFVDWSSGVGEDNVSGPARTWTKALNDAAKLTYKGVQGHLATITSESENTFIKNRLGDARNVFIAGSDKDREGQWKWYAGPESGQVFWEARCASTDACGTGQYIDRTPAVNTYSAWAVSTDNPDDPDLNEPNNYPTGEDYLITNRYIASREPQDPRWNDFPEFVNQNVIGGYVVEFSGATADYTDVVTRTATFSVTVPTPYISLRLNNEQKVQITGQVMFPGRPYEVQIQRRSGKGEFRTVGTRTAQLSENSVVSGEPFTFIDAPPRGKKVTSYDYRLVITNEVVGNRSSRIASLDVPAKTVSATTILGFKIGQHLSSIKSSIFSAKGLKPFSKFKITLRSKPVVLADTTVGADGSIFVEAQIPGSTEPGDHTVTLTGTGPNGELVETVATFTLNRDLVVTSVKDSSVTEGILPATGTSSMPYVWLAISLLLAGAALLNRRRFFR